ncbi:MAG: hypothetical protein Q7T86_03085 [Hyphomicrobiaceae bacterium]|nr:hypothetical protein [Hyphomicrobiaceae bacterium]
MSDDYWNRSMSQPPHWMRSSGGFEHLIMEQLLDQTGMLHEIKGEVRHIPAMQEQIETSRRDIADLKGEVGALAKRRSPKVMTLEKFKEHWLWLVFAATVMSNLFGGSVKLPVAYPAQTSSER